MAEVAPQMTYQDRSTRMLARSRVARAGLFDSELDMTRASAQSNGDLILRMRIAFVQPTLAPGQKIKDGDDEDFVFKGQLSGAQFADLTKKLAQRITKFWSERIWLMTPDQLSLFDLSGEGGRTYIPNLHCGFRCEAVASTATGAAAAHHTVEIVNVSEPNKLKHNFRPYSKRWPISSLGERIVGFEEAPKLRLRHFMPGHEVGHLMNLDHIGEILGDGECAAKKATSSAGGNHAMCYIAPASAAWAKHNIMGMGNHVHAVNGGPWIKALEGHLPQYYFTENLWSATTVRPAPRAVYRLTPSVYPKAETTYVIKSRASR